ncbi:uncharacterized protein [Palaemon carinicauda]|uniref:uncharacterized protein n=1 Tax=Palaemon carinicauda TaxID=392227 RepID=UPI0035B663E8
MVELIYQRTRTKVITVVGKTETYGVSARLHQGSALSQFSFMVIMDVLSVEIRNEELRELLYANNLVITAENEEDLHKKVENHWFRIKVDPAKRRAMPSGLYSIFVDGVVLEVKERSLGVGDKLLGNKRNHEWSMEWMMLENASLPIVDGELKLEKLGIWFEDVTKVEKKN